MRVIICSFIYLLLVSCYSSLNANIQDAPKIQKFQFPDKLEVNEKVGVICMLRSGKPPYTFRWLKDSKELNSGNGVIIQTGERLSNLLIDPITHASAGNYTCLVKNSAGIDSFSSILTVTASPSWNEEPFDVETVVGEKVSVKCTASGYPNPRVEWIKQGDATFFQRSDQFSLRNGTLLFNPISSGDDGEYVCSASNGVGESLVKKITILIHDPPKIQRMQVPSMVEIGEKVNIPCLIKKGSPPFKFEWLKNSVVLRNSENIEIVGNKDSSRLTINPVTDKSSGNYTCVVRTKHGSDRMTIYISVKAPPIWSSEPKDVEAIEGEITAIPCSAEGSPAPQISWKRLDNAKVFMDFRITSNNGTLVFSPVNKSHESSYVCEAYNDIGSPLKKNCISYSSW